jgi:hypothetical protein
VTECNLRQLSEDKRYAYITYQDLRGIPEYKHQTIMAIKAPPEAKLQVPHPSQVSISSISQYINSVQYVGSVRWQILHTNHGGHYFI